MDALDERGRGAADGRSPGGMLEVLGAADSRGDVSRFRVVIT